MNRRTFIRLLAAVMLGPGLLSAQVLTATFQQGTNSYTGCKAVVICDRDFNPNLGQYADNGFAYGSGSDDFIIGRLHGHPIGADYYPLLRFDQLNISNGAQVVSASLTLWLSTADPGAKVLGRYLKPYWYGDVTNDVANAPVGWRFRDRIPNNLEWASFGATNEGLDLVVSNAFTLPPGASSLIADGVMHPYTAALDRVQVQQWIDVPSTNHGVKLDVNFPNLPVSWVQPQRNTTDRPLSMRPKLSITYVYPPTLRVARVTGDLIRLSWATNSGPFLLQESAAVTGNYSDSASSVATQGLDIIVDDTSSLTSEFYRLIWRL